MSVLICAPSKQPLHRTQLAITQPPTSQQMPISVLRCYLGLAHSHSASPPNNTHTHTHTAGEKGAFSIIAIPLKLYLSGFQPFRKWSACERVQVQFIMVLRTRVQCCQQLVIRHACVGRHVVCA